MRLVQDRGQVIDNLLTLDRYRTSESEKERFGYQGLLRRGLCFVAYRSGGRLLFGPSRFIGYIDNLLAKHLQSESIDGRETNDAIERIFETRFLTTPPAEREFQSFCRQAGVVPGRQSRRFIGASRALWIDDNDARSRDVRDVRRRKLPRTTKSRLIDARLGQGRYRDDLIRLWGKCPVTGCRELSLLRASHIRPWSVSTDAERLDPFNGILLAPHIDLAFDRGLITFSDSGSIRISRRFGLHDVRCLGIKKDARIQLSKEQRGYMRYHREKRYQ